MDEPAHDELAPDAQPVASSDFFNALGPKTAAARARIIWRMPKEPHEEE